MKAWIKFVFASVLLLVGCALLVLGKVGYECVEQVDAVVAAICSGDDDHSVAQREKYRTELQVYRKPTILLMVLGIFFMGYMGWKMVRKGSPTRKAGFVVVGFGVLLIICSMVLISEFENWLRESSRDEESIDDGYFRLQQVLRGTHNQQK